jgi:hypothetical protein
MAMVPPASAAGPVVTPVPPSPAHETVDLFGDSLGYQAEPYLDVLFAQTGNYRVWNTPSGAPPPATG